MLQELLTSPGAYFSERVKYPTIRAQAGIVLLAGVLANVWHLAVIPTLGSSAAFIEDALIILTAAGVVEFFIAWLGLTALIKQISGLLGGKASYARLLRLTGYGFAPMIVAGAIWSAGWYLTLSSAPRPEQEAGSSFEASYAAFQNWLSPNLSDPILIGSLLLGSVFVVVAAYFWTIAVEVETALPRNKAAVGPALAALIYLAWTLQVLV